jgi:hypothetical protein
VLQARRLITAAVAAGACASASTSADDGMQVCHSDLPAAEIRVVAEHAEPRVDHTRPAAEIAHQLGSAPYGVALGLTQTSTTLSVEVLLKAIEVDQDAVLCARPHVNVTLRHARIDVWVARELERDDCACALVLEHEMKHVATERETLDWAARQLETQLQAWYQDRLLHGTEAQIKAGLAQDFDEKWTPVLEALLHSSSARHAEHDLQDSYGDAQACGGALYRAAMRLR